MPRARIEPRRNSIIRRTAARESSKESDLRGKRRNQESTHERKHKRSGNLETAGGPNTVAFSTTDQIGFVRSGTTGKMCEKLRSISMYMRHEGDVYICIYV